MAASNGDVVEDRHKIIILERGRVMLGILPDCPLAKYAKVFRLCRFLTA